MTNISHEQARAYVLRGRDDLKATERTALDEHLRACADCHAYADEIVVMQVTVRGTLQRRWDAVRPAADVAPTIAAHLSGRKFPQQVIGFVAGLVALVALVLLLQAFFTQQTQVKTAQSPLATLPARTATAAVPAPVTAVNDAALTRPTPTPPSGRDFYRLQRLTYTSAGAFRPAVSPDGQRIAYASERNGNWDIYVLNRSAGVELRLTDDALPDMAPAWSPDGTRIAYQHNVPSNAGSVLIDYMVMNADGSNKSVVSSGTPWRKNEAPQWSPTGDRLAFSGGDGIYVVTLDDRHETTIIKRTDQHVYASPAWVDGQHLVYVADGQVMSGDVTGNNQMVMQLTDPAQVVMAQSPYIVYVQQQGATMRINHTGLDEIPLTTWAVFPAGSIEHAALSPDGQLAAIQTDSEIVVVAAGLPPAWQQAPLFKINGNVASSDLLGVAWLPDSSGFVLVSAQGGQPDLYLAQLNQSTIDYVRSLELVVPVTNPPLHTPIPPTVYDTGVVKVDGIAFRPLGTQLPDRGFDFSATITATSPISVLAHVVAFALRPTEPLPACETRTIPTDRPFWANQADYAPGQFVYGQSFIYANDVPDADRFVVRFNLIEPGVNGRLLYCTQQIYTFSSDSVPSPTLYTTPTFARPSPTPLTPTPEPSATPMFPETPTPYVTPRYETPTPQLTLTPATSTPTSSVPTSTPTPLVPVTPEAGLVIRGLVQQSDGTRLGNVKIYRAFASYPGEVVATTDPAGYYQSQFQPIPGDEMVRVWAELPGFTFGPADTTVAWTAGAYAWRHYHGYWETTLNFTAQAAP